MMVSSYHSVILYICPVAVSLVSHESRVILTVGSELHYKTRA
jgi:hypothetical protein